MYFILGISWLQWGLIAVVLTALYLMPKRIRRLYARLMKPSRERNTRWFALATTDDVQRYTGGIIELMKTVVSNDLIDRVVSGLPDAIEEHVRERVSSLAKQLVDMRRERDELTTGGWHNIGVHVRGLKLTDDDESNYYAIVQIQPKTGDLRAHPLKKYRGIMPNDKIWDSGSPFSRLGFSKASSLGAPWYGKVNGATKTIVMLDEAYTVVV